MNLERALATVMTPPGTAAIAVVRLSGPVSRFLRDHFTKPVRPGRCVHAEITDGKHVIDDAVVVLAPEGDRADINLHGGRWVVQSFLELARREGFSVIPSDGLATTDAAVDGDSVLQREILSHLPLATTELGVRVLLGQEAAWARLESQCEPHAIRTELARMAIDPTLRHLLHPPRVAIVGAANAGKSTLANCLFGQERSITADEPGTTRDWVGDVANLQGLPVMLMDTPGWRSTDDSIERTAIDRSQSEIQSAGLVALVLDATRPLDPDQRPLIGRFPGALVVVNKCDRPEAWDVSRLDGIRTVATTGQGVTHLIERIVARFCRVRPSADSAYCWTDRQNEIVARKLREMPGTHS